MEQDELFHMTPLERPQTARPGGKKKWGGRASTNARKIVRAMLPAACWRCGGMITLEDPESSWHAGHIEDRGQGGQDSASNYAPEHSRCNTSAGGKLGAAITNGTKVAVDWTRERTLKWW
jgi:hypothetical protein